MMEKVYSIKSIKSFVEGKNIIREPITEFVHSKITEGFVVCWLNHKLLFGRIQNRKLIFADNVSPDFKKHLIKLRAFNEKEELFIWKGSSGLQYRYRIDEQGEEQEYIESEQIIWGTKSETIANGFSEVREDRGVKFIVPLEWLHEKSLSNKNRLMLITRNFISYNELGQAGFVDSRFVKITIKEGRE